jgi:hypothetical protein
MSEAQSLSYAKAQMANRLRIYQVLFRISIIANLLVGLWCIFDPVGFAQRVFQIDPYPQAWPRIWGATLLGLQLVYIPGALNPLFYRWPNWFSIAIKILMTIIFLTAGSSFYLLAAWEFIWFLILLTTYYHLLVADYARTHSRDGYKITTSCAEPLRPCPAWTEPLVSSVSIQYCSIHLCHRRRIGKRRPGRSWRRARTSARRW